MSIAKIYWRTICRGTRTMGDVPEKLKSAVLKLAQEELQAGKITQEQFDAWTAV